MKTKIYCLFLIFLEIIKKNIIKLEKLNSLEKPKEKKDLTNINNDYINIKYCNQSIKKNEDLHLLNNNYQLTEINKDIFRPNYKNIIGNNNIVKNNNILPEEEKISKLDFYN